MIFVNFCCFSAFAKVTTFFTSTSELKHQVQLFQLFYFNQRSWLEIFFFWLLKGQCHKIFGTSLFHESKPSLIYRLKWFCRKIRFCRDICNTARLRTVLANFGFSKIKISDSAQCQPARSQIVHEYLHEKLIFKQNQFQPVYQGLDWFDS